MFAKQGTSSFCATHNARRNVCTGHPYICADHYMHFWVHGLSYIWKSTWPLLHFFLCSHRGTLSVSDPPRVNTTNPDRGRASQTQRLTPFFPHLDLADWDDIRCPFYLSDGILCPFNYEKNHPTCPLDFASNLITGVLFIFTTRS